MYREILIKSTVEPKISLKNYNHFALSTIEQLVELVWNKSVELISSNTTFDSNINSYLAYEETQTYSVDYLTKEIISSDNFSNSTMPGLIETIETTSEINNHSQIISAFNSNGFSVKNDAEMSLAKAYWQYRLNFPLNINGLLEIIENQIDVKILPLNIKRLLFINKQLQKEQNTIEYQNLKQIYSKFEQSRTLHALKFPLRLLIIVEGTTEETLLPVFSEISGINFDKSGIQLIAAGGKNQVVKLYEQYKQILNLPIFIILDSDASNIAQDNLQDLRNKDKVFVIPKGEFEDILPVELICRSINAYFKMTAQICSSEICKADSMADHLVNIWKEKGLGDFSKSDFAHIVKENISDKSDISPILNEIIGIIQQMTTN